jgi:hypothetical protein
VMSEFVMKTKQGGKSLRRPGLEQREQRRERDPPSVRGLIPRLAWANSLAL